MSDEFKCKIPVPPRINPVVDLQSLMNRTSSWSNDTFGHRWERVVGMADHQREEAKELHEACVSVREMFQRKELPTPEQYQEKIKAIQEELADNFLLLLDIAVKSGLTAMTLIEATENKLEINSTRTWGDVDPDNCGAIHHQKGETFEP